MDNIEGQPRLSQVVEYLNKSRGAKQAFAAAHSATGLIDLFPKDDSDQAKAFVDSTLLFHDLESGRKVIASLCSGIGSSGDKEVDVQLLRSTDGDYHLGYRLEDDGSKIVFYVSVPAGRWCPADNDGNG
ncbi:MAG: hypothetical protein ABMA25_21975 [Ilumatobacteraceae bacterium]